MFRKNPYDKFTISKLYLFPHITFEFILGFNILWGIPVLVKANFLGSPAG